MNGGGGKPLDRDRVTDLIMEQARTLYRYFEQLTGQPLRSAMADLLLGVGDE